MQTTQPTATRWFPFLLLAAAGVAAGYALRHTLSCFLLSFVLAYLFDPFLVWLERRRIRRPYGLTILYAFLVVAVFFATTFLLPFLSVRWQGLLHDLPVYLQKGRDLAISWKSRLLAPIASEEWLWLVNSVTGQLDKIAGRIGGWFYVAVTSVVFNLFNLILAPILIFFMLLYKRTIVDTLAGWLPEKHRQTLIGLGREINASIGGYIRGQIIVSLIVALLAAIALFFLDVDYAILNGLFAGFASILPFIGVAVAVVPPLFFAYVKFQSGIAMIKVIAAFCAIYFVEGYVIKPLVFEKAMDLNPLVTIVMVMACGELFGFWGILLAVPLASAGRILADYLRRGKFAAEHPS